MNVLRCTLTALVCCAAIGCTVGGGSSDDDGADLSEREDAFTLNATTDERGAATVSFAVPEGSTKLGITIRVPDDEVFVRFIDIVDGSGNDYLSGERGVDVSLSESFQRYANSANVPSRRTDPPLNSSERFTVTAEASDGFGGSLIGETVTFSVTTKNDPGLEGGRLRVNLFYVGEVGQEQTTRDVVRAALDQFRAIYAGEAGINLDIEEADVDGPVVLPNPGEGDPFYQAASGSLTNPAVNVFIGGDIGGLGGSAVLGISSGIPGPFLPTERSAVAISIFTGAGADGIYSNDDVRLLGETIAHESGHYMGLFHPVDFSGSTVSNVDPLDDTPTCSFVTECLSNGELIQNLMFASPVADGQGGFVPQNQLSSEQQGVLNRYIVVD